MSKDDSTTFLSQFSNKIYPISPASPLEIPNCGKDPFFAETIFQFSDIYSNSNNYKKTINLDLNTIVLCSIESEKIKNIIPIKLQEIHIKIIKNIIKTKPNYFILFERLFSILILNEEHWNPTVVPYIIILFKKIYNSIYTYKMNNFYYGIQTKKLCKTIIDFLLHIIILNDTYLHKHQHIFKINMKKLIEVCLNLIDETKPKPILEKIANYFLK